MFTDSAFRMVIQDVFSIKGRGVVITGKVAGGALRVGDEVYVQGPSGATRVAVTGLEAFRKVVSEAMTGDNIGILFGDVDKRIFTHGAILSGSDTDFSIGP